MGAPADCPHDNPVITTHGPYYRQVHPDYFQDGVALPRSFILNPTGPEYARCHFALSLNDGARTTADRCHREYTQNGNRRSAAVLEVTKQELTDSGALFIVDSPDGITHAHADALYNHPMTRKERDNVGKALMTAANKRGPAYAP